MSTKIYKLIVSQIWWGVGESSRITEYLLNYINYLKTTYPNKFHVIYNMQTQNSWLCGLNPKILSYCVDLSIFENVVDEFYLDNPEYNFYKLRTEGYHEIFAHTFIDKDSIDDELQSYNIENVHHKIFGIHYENHPLNGFSKSTQMDNSFDTSKTKQFFKLGKTITDLAQEFIAKKNLTEFDAIHFRWESPYELDVAKRHEIINYWLEKMQPILDRKKTYFLSSISSEFYLLFREKYPNIKSLFIDREDLDSFRRATQPPSDDWRIPSTLPEGLIDKSTDSMCAVSDLMAFIEVAVMSNSNHIIHANDGFRIMISLFLWYPMVVKSIPVTWVHRHIIKRKLEFHKSIYEINETIERNLPNIKIPDAVCERSHGYYCESV